MKDPRCPWCLGSPEYMAYHDREWGRPVHDDRVFFEFNFQLNAFLFAPFPCYSHQVGFWIKKTSPKIF